MPQRDSLHTLINMLEDFGVFEGHRVVIEVTNGRDIHCTYDPPLLGETDDAVRERERTILAKAS